MKALIQKELRENMHLAGLGLAVHALLLLACFLAYNAFMGDVVAGRASGEVSPEKLQPLCSQLFLVGGSFFCAIFGAFLGWVQANSERHPDLWAFLVHRPITPTGVFLAKAGAGLAIYGLAAGLPLACFIAWVCLPGNVAAPFEWTMLVPAAGFFLMGVMFYFAGMLTGLRQARWYASRTLGLGSALLVSAAILNSLIIWQSFLCLFLAVAILATAVWGGFHSHGHYQGQPPLAKAALTAALTFGAMLVVLLAVGLLAPWLQRLDPPVPWFSYVMTRDGTLGKATQPAGGPQEILDLNGQPLTDGKTGQAIDPARFSQYASRNYTLQVNFGDRPPRWDAFQRLFRPFWMWRATPDTFWYYWPSHASVVGFDVRTRRAIGRLGTTGFSTNLAASGERLEPPSGHHTLRTSTALYHVDPERRSIKPLFATTPDDPIGAAQEVSLQDSSWDYAIAVTRRSVHLLRQDGKIVWKVPYEPAYPVYPQVQVSFLEQPDRFALWFTPSLEENEKPGEKLPLRVAWVTIGQGVVTATNLPNLARSMNRDGFFERFMAAMMPPVIGATMPVLFQQTRPTPIPWQTVLIGLAIAAVLWLPAGWWLGCRYGHGLGARIGWAAFHLLFGLPGFLAFLTVQEWPVLEPCSGCKKLRPADHPRCQRCGAAFPPPAQTGIEIFEPLSANHAP